MKVRLNTKISMAGVIKNQGEIVEFEDKRAKELSALGICNIVLEEELSNIAAEETIVEEHTETSAANVDHIDEEKRGILKKIIKHVKDALKNVKQKISK